MDCYYFEISSYLGYGFLVVDFRILSEVSRRYYGSKVLVQNGYFIQYYLYLID